MTEVTEIQEAGGPTVLRINRMDGGAAVLAVGIVRDGGRIEGECLTLTATQLRQAIAAMDDTDAERDAAMIEQIEDDRRVFQALCTEASRVRSLLGYDFSRNPAREAARTARLNAVKDRTERLVRVWADKISSYPGTTYGCPCIVLPSGTLYPCDSHAGTAFADQMSKAGRARVAAERAR